ncbi:MAG: glycosyltransferase family 4 protein [Bacteroidales bacterium]|nr:glycosyltransferase family 4 protein [Bacteroidales bacterium]
MTVLMVASYNKGRFAPFIVEQAEALKRAGCDVDWFGLQGKGVKGYITALKQKIKECQPDIIHAQYNLSGITAVLQNKVPAVTTYHGSDINERKVLRFSKLAMRLSAWNIFVSQKTLEIAKPSKKYTLLPCGIDLTELQLTDKQEARRRMHLDADKKYILFSGAFDNKVKNVPLAKAAVAQLDYPNVELLELKGYSRYEVTLLMCAADAFLMTSLSEGSPQVIKEAMACGCPIVSVDVGDVRERTEGVEGCYVANTRNPKDLAHLLKKALAFGTKTNGREKLPMV